MGILVILHYVNGEDPYPVLCLDSPQFVLEVQSTLLTAISSTTCIGIWLARFPERRL